VSLDPDAPDKIEQLSLVELAVTKIKKLLFAGVVQPGEPVREEWLSSRLGISRPPVREAVQALVQQGLLERLPRRGVRAVTLTDADVWEIYSLRSVLDKFALELGIPVKDPALLQPLRAAVEKMRSSSQAGDHAANVEANREFHLSLIALGGNKRLLHTYENLMNQMQLLMSVNLSRESMEHQEIGAVRHEQLLAAIESGDLAEALAALAAHGELRFLGAGSPGDAKTG
jgi:DNA-binding GntR family transcriptional regulator